MAITINLTQLKRKKSKKDETIPIYIRITEDRKSRYRSTGVFIKEKDWNSNKQIVSKSHNRHEYLNIQLGRKIREVEDLKEKLIKRISWAWMS